MAEYSSMKVPELKKLLAERGLPQSGNKADLVARLQENDKPAEQTKEDEITYSDNEGKPAAVDVDAEAAPAPVAAPATAQQPSESKPAETSEETTEGAESAAPAPSFTMGLASTVVDEEAKKRAERAKRFGIDDDEVAKKKAERAKRFGIDEKEIASSLDSALPARPLKRGRGREGGEGNRPGKRQSLDRRGGRGGRHGGGGGRQQQGEQSQKDTRNVLDDPAEKAKAEKRRQRFAN